MTGPDAAREAARKLADLIINHPHSTTEGRVVRGRDCAFCLGAIAAHTEAAVKGKEAEISTLIEVNNTLGNVVRQCEKDNADLTAHLAVKDAIIDEWIKRFHRLRDARYWPGFSR